MAQRRRDPGSPPCPVLKLSHPETFQPSKKAKVEEYMKKKSIVIVMLAVAIIAVLLLLVGQKEELGSGAGMMQGAQVTVYSVVRRPLADRTEALGTARAQESVDLSATVTERIDEIHFTDGEWVKKGQILVTLRQASEQAQLSEERENLAEQQRELRRLEDLVRRRLSPETEMDQRRTQVARSEFRIEEIEARLADLTIRAPFDGQMGLRRISPGALAQPGMVMATLDDISRIKLDFRIPATLLATVEEGQPVLATTPSYDRMFEGEVVAIDSRINAVDRSVGVLAEFDNPDRLLKPGLLMMVELRRQPRNALVVPEETLVARQLQQFVWLVDPDTREVRQHAVTIGLREPGWVEIVSGLEEGQWIIQEGVGLVRDGMIVEVSNADNPNVAPERIGDR